MSGQSREDFVQALQLLHERVGFLERQNQGWLAPFRSRTTPPQEKGQVVDTSPTDLSTIREELEKRIQQVEVNTHIQRKMWNQIQGLADYCETLRERLNKQHDMMKKQDADISNVATLYGRLFEDKVQHYDDMYQMIKRETEKQKQLTKGQTENIETYWAAIHEDWERFQKNIQGQIYYQRDINTDTKKEVETLKEQLKAKEVI